MGADDSARALPRVSPNAWSAFLAAECASCALSERLGNAVAHLPDSMRETLQRAARAETQRVLAARAQLAAIDQLADRCGVEPVVLKGGVHAVDGGTAFDLGDIDLMLDAGALGILGGSLIASGGYRHHARPDQYLAAGAIAVELHDGLHVGFGVDVAAGAESRPLHGSRRLRRLAPVAHVAYCVQHSTTQHPQRRGHLRDLLLIADALDDCTPAERDAVARALDESPWRVAYRQTLTLAAAMRAGTLSAAPPDDPFTRHAAGKYAMSIWFVAGSGDAFPSLINHVPHFVASAGDGWRLVNGYLRTSVPPASRWYWPAAARFSTRLAEALGAVARTPYRVTALGYAFIVGMVIRWRVAFRWHIGAPARK